MAITSKQRAFLRGLAMNEDTIIQIGKGGITDNLVLSVVDALHARELVKGKVLESSMLTAREACVLYKRNAKEPKIELPKDRKKA